MGRNMPTMTRGSTLTELMIAVGIVAILTAVVYPGYRNYALSRQLIDATGGLAILHASMERYFQDHRTYTPVGAYVPPCLNAPPTLVVGSFQMSCTTTPTATKFKVQATGSGNTKGFVFYVDQDNTQSTVVTGVSGWNSCATAWVTRAGQRC